MEGKISIIVPVYNSMKYLDKCIESIAKQSYKDLEIILINDGSTDNSLNLIKSWAVNDKRIIVINKTNGGVSSARNLGLEIASGDFIGFIDSDDFIEENMFKDLHNALVEHKADIAECGYYIVDEQYQLIKQKFLEKKVVEGSYECSKDYLAKKNTTNFVVNKLYRKSLFENIRFPNLKYSEDYSLNVKVFYRCKKKVTIKNCCYYYYTNPESAVNRPFSMSKLDGITAGEDLFRFHESRYPDLQSYIALYILKHIIRVYRELIKSDIKNSGIHQKDLVNKYKEIFPKIHGEAYKEIKFKKVFFIIWMFYINPKIYILYKNKF